MIHIYSFSLIYYQHQIGKLIEHLTRIGGPGFESRSGYQLCFPFHYIWCSANSWSWQGKEPGVTFDGEDHIKGKSVMIGLVQILAEVSSIARAPAWVKIVGSGGGGFSNCYTVLTFRYLCQVWCKLIDCIGSFIECKVRSNAKKKIGI